MSQPLAFFNIMIIVKQNCLLIHILFVFFDFKCVIIPQSFLFFILISSGEYTPTVDS